MGRRLKQIKRGDLGDFGKQVVDSLINTKKRPQKDEKEEQMRCKVEIYEGTLVRRLTDSFIVNTNYIEDTVSEIVSKYGENVQFIITNLYNEETVAKRFTYIGGYDKERVDREHYNHQMELYKRVQKLKEDGKTEEQACDKTSHLASRSYIREIYRKSEEDFKNELRDEYGNQNLGKSQSNILTEDLNTKKDILTNSNLKGENDEE